MMRFLLLSLFFLTACGDSPVGREARILAMGDSMLAGSRSRMLSLMSWASRSLIALYRARG